MRDALAFEGPSLKPASPDSVVGTATVRAPGVCGELVQGMLGEAHFLVTCPVDLFARVRVTLHRCGPGVEATAGCSKAASAVRATLAHLGRDELAAKVAVSSPIPRGIGMGSSSADVAAAIAATALALGVQLSPEAVARIALSVEPTDGLMLQGIALMDHREGRIMATLGPPPPMDVIALDFGGTVDTVEFNTVDRRSAWRSIQPEVDEALRLVRAGIRRGDAASVGRGASISATASQSVLPKPKLPAVLEFARSAGAVGVDVGHSGVIIGVLLDAREERGRSVYGRARQAFPEAEAVHLLRLRGGGLEAV